MTTFALRIDHRAWLDKPEVATAIGEVLDHPSFRALRRVAYNTGVRETRHQPRTAASVKEILLSKDCDSAVLDSGRTGELTATGAIFTGRHIQHWDADKRVIDSHVIVPYDTAAPLAIVEGFSLLAVALDAFGGYLYVEPSFIRARAAVYCQAPRRHEVRDYPRRARERKAHARYAEWHETRIAGPEWGLFLGPGHLARVTPDPAVFPIIRDVGRGKLCLLSENPEDALTEAFDARLEDARRALAPILMDLSEVPVDE